jgi:periplasmic copper chaperone A
LEFVACRLVYAGVGAIVRRPKMKNAFVIVLTAMAAPPAGAHVLLEGKQAAVGSLYEAVFVVPHGCNGSATTKLRVQIPEGVIATEAKPASGWSVETVKGKYAGEYGYNGAKVSQGIKEVAWVGGKLPDKTRAEFVIETYLTDGLKPNTTLYFPVVQECETGVSRWIEIPPDGAVHSHETKWPAPGVKLAPKP